MQTKTKIICTIGPSCNTLEKMIELIHAGMSVARINFSHGSHEEHSQVIDKLKQAREIADKPLAIMLDTKGPEMRVGKFPKGFIEIEAKQRFKIVASTCLHDDEIPVKPFEALKGAGLGQKLLFDDGNLISKVIEVKNDHILIEFYNGGILKSSKSINAPSMKITLPAVTEQDVKDLIFGCENDVDLVAASFIRSAEHVLQIKQILSDHNGGDILVIAKIENHEGVENFNEIVAVADGIMVARGDLGVEVDLSLVPKLQKLMISRCHESAKPVVIATQMLESMINNPRPTRAEVSDVANAIYESASCVMLSGETAAGKYPVETVRQMGHIVIEAEKDFDYRDFFYHSFHRDIDDVSASVAMAAVKTAYSLNADGIFATTKSGHTARTLNSLRPSMPVFVMTNSRKKYQQLAFSWGVNPLFVENFNSVDEVFQKFAEYTLEKQLLIPGSLIVMLSSYPFDLKGVANLMMIKSLGNVLIRFPSKTGKKIKGKVLKVLDVHAVDINRLKDTILVIKKYLPEYDEILKHAKGVILQINKAYSIDENRIKNFEEKNGVLFIVLMKNIDEILENDQMISIDSENGLIYHG